LDTEAEDATPLETSTKQRHWRPWLRTLVWQWFAKCGHELFKSSKMRLPIKPPSIVTPLHMTILVTVSLIFQMYA
jgi:hypothetical protein